MRKAILADDRIQVDSLGCENMVCLNNGILDLNSMTFMPHNPQYLFDPCQVYNAGEAEEQADVRSAAIIDSDKIYGYDVENRFFVTSEDDGFVRTYLGEADLEPMGEDTDT